jgi:hypothetical protein
MKAPRTNPTRLCRRCARPIVFARTRWMERTAIDLRNRLQKVLAHLDAARPANDDGERE